MKSEFKKKFPSDYGTVELKRSFSGWVRGLLLKPETVLEAIPNEGIWGRDLRAKLSERGFYKSAVGFYILMGKMEKKGEVLRETKAVDTGRVPLVIAKYFRAESGQGGVSSSCSEYEKGFQAGVMAAWSKANSLIVRGELDGNGCDPSAQRNGLVMACNEILELNR